MNWLRRLLNRRAMSELCAERTRLATAVMKIDVYNPKPGERHTIGMYDGVTRAISILERDR